jgi:hypothetical protein
VLVVTSLTSTLKVSIRKLAALLMGENITEGVKYERIKFRKRRFFRLMMKFLDSRKHVRGKVDL